ncbi:MAG: segregation/condensation protein A [Candidatus Micrarchaeia archaeon]
METQTISFISEKNLNLAEFVKNATWKELLIELVETNRIDPWNIDISRIVEDYIAIIKQMEFLDLRVPANIVLAASTLLYIKSLSLKLIDEQITESESVENNAERVLPEVPQLINKIRIQPNRKITLFELMEALDEAIKIKQDKEIEISKKPAPLILELSTEDIDKKIENIYNIININVDTTKMLTFSNLSKDFIKNYKEKNILIDLFIPVLFLAHKKKITIFQDIFFGEIFIKLNST